MKKNNNQDQQSTRPRELMGVVASTKMDKTVVVVVSRSFRHPLYQKIVRVDKRYMAHSEDSSLAVGDKVKIVETRPVSKHKHFRVVEKLG